MELGEFLASKGLQLYEKSLNTAGGALVCMARGKDADFIVSRGADGFKGEKSCGFTISPADRETACALRKLFPFTSPSPVLREKCSFGVGDRLGIAADGHILKSATRQKSTRSKHFDIAANRNIFQFEAEFECMIFDAKCLCIAACWRAAYRHALQPTATDECMKTNSRNGG